MCTTLYYVQESGGQTMAENGQAVPVGCADFDETPG